MAAIKSTTSTLDLTMPSKKKISRRLDSRICIMCGRPIHKNSIRLEKNFDGLVCRFDSESCLLIFQKLRVLYGRNFFKPYSRKDSLRT